MKGIISLRHLVIRLLIFFCMSTLLVSCDDFLGDVTPGNAIPLDTGLDNPQALQSFLTGTYGQLAGMADAFMLGLPDLSTEDTDRGICGGGNPWADFCHNNVLPTNPLLYSMWNSSYRIINQANIIIERVEGLLKSQQIDDVSARQLSGEAYFIRGVMYFEMIRLFALPYECNSGLGVPILTRGVDNTDEITLPARGATEDVYNQAISDLNMASERLSQEKGQQGKPSYYAAIAYLAEIAFQKGEYSPAADYARMIIESGLYQLVATPDDFFRNKNTPEEIWSVFHSKEESGELWSITQSNLASQFGLSLRLVKDVYGRIATDIQKNKLKNNSWSVDDQRFTTLTNVDTFELESTKYNDPFGGDNLPAKRYSEILLMYAECLARLDRRDEAIVYLNMIRERAIIVRDAGGNPVPEGIEIVLFTPDDFSNTDDLIEAIILERQVELIMEGNRFHDLIRLGRPVNGLDYKHDKLRWPIPKTEVDLNPNLVQNPGY